MKAAEPDRGLNRFVRRLPRDELDGVAFRDARLHVALVKAAATPEGRTIADRIEGMMAARVRRIAEYDASSSRMWSVVSANGIIRTINSSTTCQCLIAGIATLSRLDIAHTLHAASFGGGSELSLFCLGKGVHGDC